MGLKISKTTPDNVSHPDSYHRIMKHNSTHTLSGIEIFKVSVDAWHTKADRTALKSPIFRNKVFSITIPTLASQADIWELLYDGLKNDPYFTGAVTD